MKNSRTIYTTDFPASLREHHNWNLIDLKWDDQKQKYQKTPISAITALPANRDGIGIPCGVALNIWRTNAALSYRHPAGSERYLGLIDCDRCVNTDGTVTPQVQQLLKEFNSYADYSVSGDGIHILSWLTGVPPGGHKHRESGLGFYWENITIPMTAKRVQLPDWSSPDDVEERTEQYLKLHRELFPQAYAPSVQSAESGSSELTPEEVLELLFNERNGPKWKRLFAGDWQGCGYPTQSHADLALLTKLGFYTGGDPYMMSQIFSMSDLAQRSKWERYASYRDKTISKAVETLTAFYQRGGVK